MNSHKHKEEEECQEKLSPATQPASLPIIPPSEHPQHLLIFRHKLVIVSQNLDCLLPNLSSFSRRLLQLNQAMLACDGV